VIERAGHRQCLNCGMQHPVQPGSIIDRDRKQLCEKCDASLWDLSDGSIRTVDIAHHGETVSQALDKLYVALENTWKMSYAAEMRVIVGGGLIRDAVLAELHYRLQSGVILGLESESRGAVIIRIRPSPGH
jgi:uncharacterized protein YuzB (UPF0349 family)